MKGCDEWSREFDILYSNITSNQAPGLTEYEKSVFLTRAEEAVVVMLYNGTLRDSFEETEEVTDYLASLVTQKNCNEVSVAPHIVPSSKVYRLPDDMLFRTYESCRIDTTDCGEVEALVTPVTQDEFWRTTRNPFKRQNGRKVLRLTSGLSESMYSELVSDHPITRYTIRYIKRPEPIILDYLPGGLTVNGESTPKACKLNEALHQTILTEAVKAAKAVWSA